MNKIILGWLLITFGIIIFSFIVRLPIEKNKDI
jgi:hypothetical protein